MNRKQYEFELTKEAMADVEAGRFVDHEPPARLEAVIVVEAGDPRNLGCRNLHQLGHGVEMGLRQVAVDGLDLVEDRDQLAFRIGFGLAQLDELDDRAEIIAEMQVSGRLHAGKYQLFESHVGSAGWRERSEN